MPAHVLRRGFLNGYACPILHFAGAPRVAKARGPFGGPRGNAFCARSAGEYAREVARTALEQCSDVRAADFREAPLLAL